jgi:hypothetical protein
MKERWNSKKPSRKPALMWELDVDAMKATWAPGLTQCEEGESKVALVVANAFLEDAPHILRAEDILIPTNVGDQERAQACFLWLAKKVVPMWIPSWIDRAQPYRSDDLKRDTEELEGDEVTTNEQIGTVLMAMRFAIPEADKVHRRSMHKAQQMGVRAAYRGALLHRDAQVHMLALLAANLIVFAVPDQENYRGSLLLVEATQSSALVMMDNLLLERSDA